MRAQEFLKKRSTENLDEGVIDFISKSKDKFLRLKDALSDEWAQTKEMWEIVQKRKTATQKEINFANSQFKDILRVAGLSAWYALPIPGNTLLILATEKILNKVGMSIIPDKIRNQVLMSKQQGVAEGQLDPYRLERLDPQTRRVLTRMADHKDPGSWLSASEAYAMSLGLQYKNRDPRGWEQDVQRYVDLYRQYSGQDVAEGTEPTEQTMNQNISDLVKDAMGTRPNSDWMQRWMAMSVDKKLALYQQLVSQLD